MLDQNKKAATVALARELHADAMRARHSFVARVEKDSRNRIVGAPRPAGAKFGIVTESAAAYPHITSYTATLADARDYIRRTVAELPEFSAGRHTMTFSLTTDRPYMRAQVEKFGLISYSVVEL